MHILIQGPALIYVSEILQLFEIIDFLIDPGLCRFHGMMEY